MKSGKSNHKDTTQERMKAEKREDVYPQMTPMCADKEILPSPFILHPSSFILHPSAVILSLVSLWFILLSPR
jgi:hypothetical protein